MFSFVTFDSFKHIVQNWFEQLFKMYVNKQVLYCNTVKSNTTFSIGLQ